eukprot:s1543_g40.t1
MQSRKQVTQVRRIESLWHRLSKLEKEGPSKPTTVQELQQEWGKITRSLCFGKPFLHWLCEWPNTSWPDWPLPSAQWIYHALQISRFQTEVTLQDEAAIRARKTHFARQEDRANCSKEAFAIVRGPSLPRVHEIGNKLQFEAMLIPDESGLQHDVFADANLICDLRTTFPVALGDVQGQVIHVDTHFATVRTTTPVHAWSDNIVVSQFQFVIAPGDIAKALDEFWRPIWTRDPEDLSFLQEETAHTELKSFFDFLPPHPDVQVDMQDSHVWTQAVQKLKSGSARGSDLISAQELKLIPVLFLQSLARVLGQYENGFPDHFMHGLVCPLAKTDEIPRNDQTRPITLLPQIYRLWSSVLCLQVTRVLCAWIPMDVTGLLPRRGASMTAYATQFAIEQPRQGPNTLSGLTLDIRKCFNCIKWRFAFHAMLALGIPRAILVIWIRSLSVLTRHWLVCNQIITSGDGTCGFPEGDQLSVTVMIAIATTFTTYARHQHGSEGHLSLSAYADNWSWIVDNHRKHLPLMQSTYSVTGAAGLDLDLTKTWFWANSNADARLIPSLLSACTQGAQIQRKTSAADLGYQLQYNGKNLLGILQTRLDKGLKRLSRLQSMPHALGVKEHMLKSSIFPAALHGSEIKPPSIDSMQMLRSRSAHALFGHCKSMSPALALACTNGTILDPEFWLISKAIAMARSFLSQQPEDTKAAFFRTCARFRGTLHQVCGPASALSHMFCNIGWQIDPNGLVHVSAFLSFPLLGCSSQRLTRFLVDAWMDRLVILHTARYSLFQFADIARLPTVAVLKKFSDKKRWMLIREISGAFQTSSQKKTWVKDATDTCDFCDMKDSREHRLLEFAVGAECRQPYLQLLHDKHEADSHLLKFPVLTVHPNLEALLLMQFQIPSPCWGDEIVDMVTHRLHHGETLHWFTDGSCKHPSDPQARTSAFAIVLDLCKTDHERAFVANHYRYWKHGLSSFQLVCSSRTQGEQDILRAETSAIVEIAEKFGKGIIHTDSQTAMHNAQRAIEASTISEFLACEHFDLLLRLWNIRHSLRLSIVKVKAHQQIHTIADPLLRYWALGNDFVDHAANFACHNLMPELVTHLHDLHVDISRDKEQLEAIFHLHVELQLVRSKAAANQRGETFTPQHDHAALCRAYKEWKVDSAGFSFPEGDLRFLGSCTFGGEFARLAYTWMQSLVWPVDETGPIGVKTGITWIELALSFMVFAERYLPCLRKDEQGTLRLCFISDYQAAVDRAFTLSEAGTMLQKLVCNCSSLIPQKVWPDLQHAKVSSLYRLGCGRFHQGLVRRPQMPHQDIVTEIVTNMMSLKAIENQTPLFPHKQNAATIAEGSWTRRIDQAKSVMVKAHGKDLFELGPIAYPNLIGAEPCEKLGNFCRNLAEDLDYGEALALQAQPGQGSSSSSGLLNDTTSVRGGLQREESNKTANKVYKKFQEKYPGLATVIAQNSGEEERLSTFHQGGPSSSGESQDDLEPQDKKATTVYYSSEEETEVKNEPGTSSAVKQKVPNPAEEQRVQRGVGSGEAPAARGEERRSNWSSNYSGYTEQSRDTNWTYRDPPQQRQWAWQEGLHRALQAI